MMYIYLITCRANNKVYVGQHSWNGIGLDNNYFCSSQNPEFWDDVNNYGIDNFTKDMIMKCWSTDALNIMETIWIKYYRRILGDDNVYNISDGGCGWYGYNAWLNSHKDVKRDIHSRAAKTAWKNGTNPIQNLTPEDRKERTRKAIETMGEDGLKARSKSQIANLGPEGCHNRALKAARTLGPEGLRDRALKAVKTQIENGNFIRQILTTEQKSEIARRIARTLGPEGCKERSRKAAIKLRSNWVFYNPVKDLYRIHTNAWVKE